jgi:hypothetical protein
MASSKEHVVVLMHDRAFRNSQGIDPARTELYPLLLLLQQHGCSFGTMCDFLLREWEPEIKNPFR